MCLTDEFKWFGHCLNSPAERGRQMLLCVLVIKTKTLSHLYFFVPGPQYFLQPKNSFIGAGISPDKRSWSVEIFSYTLLTLMG